MKFNSLVATLKRQGVGSQTVFAKAVVANSADEANEKWKTRFLLFLQLTKITCLPLTSSAIIVERWWRLLSAVVGIAKDVPVIVSA